MTQKKNEAPRFSFYSFLGKVRDGGVFSTGRKFSSTGRLPIWRQYRSPCG